jgi:hypothetical protein
MILGQSVINRDDMHKVTDDMLREIDLTIDDCGGKVAGLSTMLLPAS